MKPLASRLLCSVALRGALACYDLRLLGGILGKGEEGMNSFLEAYEGDGQEGLASNAHTCRRTFVVTWRCVLFFFFIHPLWSVVRIGGTRFFLFGRWPRFTFFFLLFLVRHFFSPSV